LADLQATSYSINTASARSQSDAQQQMGKACCNVVERASRGAISCPVTFEDAVDLQYGGVLVALPALIASGILKGISRFDLSKVYYTTAQIFLSLSFMVMLRVKQLEQSKLLSCGELGRWSCQYLLWEERGYAQTLCEPDAVVFERFDRLLGQ